TPLRLAAEYGHVEIARLLVEARADKDKVCGRDQRSALGMASERNHVEVVRFLLEAGASKDPLGDSYKPLTKAS
ncbi:unnamed protein product, partial [Symbiodinium pilosum]